MIEEKIATNHKKIILEFASYFTRQGKTLYLVGGSIRDCLIGKALYDYDYCTDALPHEVIRFFEGSKAKVIKTGIQHGTVTVRFRGMPFEVTTFRTESDYSDARHPNKIEFTRSIEEDLSRRDFTINAIAVKLPYFEMIDPYQGVADIKAKRLVAIGEPKDRFNEDALRILRLFRFMAKLQFTIEERTLFGAVQCKEKLRLISAERIRMEMEKLLLSHDPTATLELMQKEAILPEILPELSAGYGLVQNRYHLWDVFYHSLYTLKEIAKLTAPLLLSQDEENSQSVLMLRWAALLHDIGKPAVKKAKKNSNGVLEHSFHQHDIIGSKMAKEILTRLKCPNKTIKTVSLLIEKHMILNSNSWSDKKLKTWMQALSPDLLEPFYLLVEADRRAHRNDEKDCEELWKLKKRIQGIQERNEAISLKDLNISGKELIKQGFKSGPSMGVLLEALLDQVLESPSLNEKETLFKLAKKLQRSTKMNTNT